jgi:hypothetical protein
VLAYLRRGETFAELAAGFGVGTATAWRYVTETAGLLAARSPYGYHRQRMGLMPRKVNLAGRRASCLKISGKKGGDAPSSSAGITDSARSRKP